jgi:hypothetical protein
VHYSGLDHADTVMILFMQKIPWWQLQDFKLLQQSEKLLSENGVFLMLMTKEA